MTVFGHFFNKKLAYITFTFRKNHNRIRCQKRRKLLPNLSASTVLPRWQCLKATRSIIFQVTHTFIKSTFYPGRKAVDTLVESKKYGAGAKEPKFASAAQAQDFLSNLLTSGLFFRAKILVPKKKDDPRRSKREEVKESPRVRRAKQADEEEKAGESGYDSKKDEQAKKEVSFQ